MPETAKPSTWVIMIGPRLPGFTFRALLYRPAAPHMYP